MPEALTINGQTPAVPATPFPSINRPYNFTARVTGNNNPLNTSIAIGHAPARPTHFSDLLDPVVYDFLSAAGQMTITGVPAGITPDYTLTQTRTGHPVGGPIAIGTHLWACLFDAQSPAANAVPVAVVDLGVIGQ
jgi:hypothetical protein